MALPTMGSISREHCSPEAFACDIQHRIAAGALIDGYNAASCHDGCGRVIAWDDHDGEGPDPVQADGFLCACGDWCSNDCGDRATRTCGDCRKAGC